MNLGIIGGGQLGMMLTEASRDIPSITGVIVLDPTENCPASQAGAKQIVADFRDGNAIERLAEMCDVITYEIESGDSEVLSRLQSKARINPAPETLRIIQDKYLQKRTLADNGIPVPEFAAVRSRQDVEAFAQEYPILLKARRDGYDGRGNYVVRFRNDIDAALETFRGRQVMAERFVPFDMEVSVIAARSTTGEIATYGLAENIHKNNILKTTIAPARVGRAINEKAQELASKTMEVLRGAGVFGIEMFVQDGAVLINEIAPRVHNSGHHTLQSCKTTQFHQHLRAILGMKLGDTELVRPTIMRNILGPENLTGPYETAALAHPNAHLKMYGKAETRPRRKMGHINIVSSNGQTADDLLAVDIPEMIRPSHTDATPK